MTGTGLNRYKDCNLQSVVDMMCNTNKTEFGKYFLTLFRINSPIPHHSEFLTDTESLANEFRTLSSGGKTRRESHDRS
jgi:hypothetical protein